MSGEKGCADTQRLIAQQRVRELVEAANYVEKRIIEGGIISMPWVDHINILSYQVAVLCAEMNGRMKPR
jgi:hypothetical protein